MTLDWQKTGNYRYDDNELQEHLNNGGNYGICGGFGFMLNLDCDTKGTIDLAEQCLPPTFTVERIIGKRHYHFTCKHQPNKKIKLMKESKDYGEIQTFGGQMVCPESTHETGDIYKVIKDLPIAEISLEQLKFVFKEYIKENQQIENNKVSETKETIPITDLINISSLTKRGDEYQGVHPIHGSDGGNNFCVNPTKNTWHCFRCDSGGDSFYWAAVEAGIISCDEAKPGRLRGKDFIETAKIIEQKTGRKILNIKEEKEPMKQEQPKTTTNPETETIKTKTAYEIYNLKPNNKYIVESFIYPQNVIMLFSPPKNYKSMMALYLAMCVANGRKFFGLKTKKGKVLYLDRENNDSLIHQRLHALRRGHLKQFFRKNFPLNFLIRQGDFENQLWVEQLINTIKKEKIKLIFIDTMKRYSSNFDENSANDINRIYINVYQPIIDECNCSIVFLHHTNRTGDYRGSGDFLGMVDSAYQIGKIGKDGFKMSCFAARGGEIDEIVGTLDIEQDKNKQLYSAVFTQKSKEEIDEKASTQWTKKKQACSLIMGYFKSKGLDQYRKKDIEEAILIEEKDEISKETIKLAFRYLVFKNILHSDGKGLYTKQDDWVE